MRAARRRRGSVRVVELYRLRATPAVDRELHWFFNLAESEMGPESNFGRLLSPVSAEGHWRTPEDHAEATHAYRRRAEALGAPAPLGHEGFALPPPSPEEVRQTLGVSSERRFD